MKIAVDGYELNKNFTGVGRYLYNLIKHLVEIDKDNEYTIFLKERTEKSDNLDNINKMILNTNKGYTYWQNFILKKEFEKNNYDILFATNYFLPFFLKGKSILTVHDISWKTIPEDYCLKDRFIKEIKSRYSFKKTDLIFTVSRFSKDELIKYYNVNHKKIKPIHSGVEEKFKRADKTRIKIFKEKYGIENSEIIGFIGSMFPRRSIKELVLGYKIAKQKIKNLKLFIVGKNYYKEDIGKLLREEGVIWKERLEENEINDFYSSLELFVYLSKYEGFGFPPLEALKCGTIPFLLKTSSLKEVFKDMAIFTEEPIPEKISEKINSYFSNQDAIKKDILTEFNTKSDYFSWKRVAENYLENINRLKKK
jgi:glycosyltransferase involved in cell wall biosynthesis